MWLKQIIFVVFSITLFFGSICSADIIPQNSWTLKYVDSQELVGENGAAKNAFDGNPGSFWHTAWFASNPSHPHEIQIDLGLAYNINGFRCLPRQDGSANGRIIQYEFYVSDDGVAWGAPLGVGSLVNSSAWQEVVTATKYGRYVRLRALSEVNGKPWTSLAELNVLGTVPSGNFPPNGVIGSLSKDVTIPLGGQLRFSGTGTDPDNSLPLRYRWNFGNGSGIPDSSLQNPGLVKFDIPGTHVVTFTVADSLGAVDPTPDARIVTVMEGGVDLVPYWAGVEVPPFQMLPPPAVVNPVITGSSVTDRQSVSVADPFLFVENNQHYLFFEVINASSGHGEIAVAKSPDGVRWQYEQVVLDEPWHLSYPYVFKFNGQYYLIPESADINEVRLYRATNFPYQWSYQATLISGRPFVDNSVFWYNNSWWMYSGDQSNNNLFLFYSDNLSSGWVEHPLSPVVRNDASKARPAGRPLVFDQDRILRFGQKSNTTYGEQVRVFEIDVLTRVNYVEREIVESPLFVKSGSGWNATGMHHFDPWWTGRQWLGAVDGVSGDNWSIGVYLSKDPSAPESVIDTPTANVTISPGGKVNFTGSGSDPDGNLPLTYRWSFGAGSGVPDSNLKDPGLIQFNTVGTFTVTFAVTDAQGIPDLTPATVVVRVASSAPAISQAGWKLLYVDSQELVGENGAATNAFDGKSGTIWHTRWLGSAPGPPHEIQIDLGSLYDIEGFRYLPRQDGVVNGTIAQYEFYVSSDGTAWSNPVASGSFVANTLEKEVVFVPVSGRFIRLRALAEVNGKAWSSVAELNVLARPYSGNQPPDGVIGSPSGGVTINAGATVLFAGTGSDPDGNLPLAYRWSFGVGSGVPDSMLKDPGAVQFNSPGVYTVSFRVTDAKGLSDPTPATVVVTVRSNTPVIPRTGWRVAYVDSQELAGENGAAVNAFDGKAETIWHTAWSRSSPAPPHEIQIDLGMLYEIAGFRYLPRQDGGLNGTIAQYEYYVSRDGANWGSPVAAGTFLKNASEKEVVFPPATGQFVRLRALSEVNGNPWTSVAELNLLGRISSSNQPPLGAIVSPYGNIVLAVGGGVAFSGTGSDPDGNLPLSYRWNFGSGSGVPESNLKDPGLLTFNVAGTYPVTLTVTDALGSSDPTPQSIVVTVVPSGTPVLATNFSSNSPGVGLPFGWTERWVTGETSYTIQDSLLYPGQRELLYQTSAYDPGGAGTGGGRRILAYDGANGLNADAEMLVLFQPNLGGTGHTDTRIYLRASGLKDNETGYFLTHGDNTSGAIALYKYVNGVITSDLDKREGVPLDSNKRYWARVRAAGSQLSAKVWPYGGLEPAAWDLAVVDNSITSPGWSGIGIFPKTDFGRFYQVAVSGSGGTATPISSGVTTASFNLMNLDAESGTTHWVNEFGTLVVDPTYQRSGAYCFAGGAANWRGYRRVDLLAAGVTVEKKQKGAYVSFSAWQRAFLFDNDPGRIGIRFLDSSMTEISSVFSPWDNFSVKYARKHLVEKIPSNAAFVDLVLEGRFVSGATTGAYFDDMEAGYSVNN